jgi:NADPH:quinone reductase-like Zn-dependent oxidoreductase
MHSMSVISVFNSKRTMLAAAMATAWSVSVMAAPAKMQAIVQVGAGAGATLQLQTVDTPKPAAGQVLIKIHAAGVNPVDWKRRLNSQAAASGAAPTIPGFDAAGVIDSVGSGVTNWKAGDAVFARVSGSYAEYAVAAADDAAAKPKSFTYEQAAGIPVAGVAAYRAAEEANIKTGQRVAVIGAAGGAGSVAVAIAKAKGAKVIASGHSSQQAYLKALGVDDFVAYDKENVATRIRDVDAVLNMVDGQAEPALAYIHKGGYLTSIAGGPSAEKCTAAGISCVTIGPGYNRTSQGEALRALAELANQGSYKVTVSKTFPLAQATAAQELNRAGDTMGKIILTIDPQSGRR